MLSQFTREGKNQSLADLDFLFPKDVYPIGRLDADSEGLLLLTNDPGINNVLLDPSRAHVRKYLLQVEGSISATKCKELEQGVKITIKGSYYKSLPCKVDLVVRPEDLMERDPPVRFRKSVPTSWITIELIEGKNRQLRKMTAAVGFPTLRLLRIAIEELLLEDIKTGEVKEYEKGLFFKKLKIGDR